MYLSRESGPRFLHIQNLYSEVDIENYCRNHRCSSYSGIYDTREEFQKESK